MDGMMDRIVSWFSCGAASAVATKLILAEGNPVTIAYCRVKEEHQIICDFLKIANNGSVKIY